MFDPIQVWAFKDAPQHLQDLSPHGGDEDWVAVLPAYYEGEEPFWMESGSRFGCCSCSKYLMSDGRTVVIGAHA